VVASSERVRVWHRGVLLADTSRSLRVLETSHAPAYYIPADDVRLDYLKPNRHRSWCEFKGRASYADLVIAECTVPDVCWWYPDPSTGYEELRDAVCFYPQRVDSCEVDGESVIALDSAFYGDWPTSRIAGPYKGAPGTEGW
jgi:uncharacterized protein (DUF427 family)